MAGTHQHVRAASFARVSLAAGLAVALVAVAGLGSAAQGASLQDKNDGAPSNASRLPYLVSITRPGTREHVCSGTLIHPRYVLTAAHCVDPNSQYSAGPKPVVHIGADGIDQPEQDGTEVMMVERTEIPSQWQAENKAQRSAHNIAVLQLPRKSKHPVPRLLTNHFKTDTGMKLVAVGFGSSPDGPQLGGEIFASKKMESQDFITADQCNKASLWGGSIPKGMVCGLNEDRKSSCIVDSGSPLLLLDMPGLNTDAGTPTLDFLIGVNADGAACGTMGKPDVYVDVRVHGEWLQQKTGADGSGNEKDEL